MTDQAIEIQSAIPAIMERVRREAEQQIERECLATIMRAANAEAQSWATEVLAPEIRAQLDAGKQGMLERADEMAKRMTDALADALVAQITKNLSQSWNVRKVVEALIGN
jgi:galactokinase/mevalonate kinase-like predicted kinase